MSFSDLSHSKVNLGRLVSRLERILASGVEDKTWWEVRKLSEDANYARELLDSIAVRDEEETGASTSTAFSTYEAKLNKISMSLILAQPATPPLPPVPIYMIPPPPEPLIITTTATAPVTSSSLSSINAADDADPHTPPTPAAVPDIIPGSSADTPDADASTAPLAEHTFRDALIEEMTHIDSSLRRRTSLSPEVEVASPSPTFRTPVLSDEAHRRAGLGLAPATEMYELQERQQQSSKLKDQSGIVGSTSRLHDELTEQLAQMSTQLRKNALHFSNSLEAEKPLLEQGASLLESNVSKLTGSQVRLGTVSASGRSNTWLVIGACGVVSVAWLWMYLIIRMT